LVQSSTAVQVAQLQLHFDVSLEYFFAGGLADGTTKHEACSGEVTCAQLEMCGVDPKLAKRKRFVRYDSQGSLADGPGAHNVVAIQLLKHSVLDP
jgi:hypothetical protein